MSKWLTLFLKIAKLVNQLKGNTNEKREKQGKIQC